MGLQIQQTKHGNLHVMLLIRSGSNQNIKIQQLPLQGKWKMLMAILVIRNPFTLDDFKVKINASKQ